MVTTDIMYKFWSNCSNVYLFIKMRVNMYIY